MTIKQNIQAKIQSVENGWTVRTIGKGAGMVFTKWEDVEAHLRLVFGNVELAPTPEAQPSAPIEQ